MTECHTYDYIEFNKGVLDNIIDAVYVILLKNSDRTDSVYNHRFILNSFICDLFCLSIYHVVYSTDMTSWCYDSDFGLYPDSTVHNHDLNKEFIHSVYSQWGFFGYL